MKYMIHSHEKRIWYINKYLIPSLIKQGIKEEDIIVWNDKDNWGNLTSFIKSCEWVIENESVEEGIWHIQDDIVIASDFKEHTEQHNKEYIGCGFKHKRFDEKDNKYKLKGKQPMENIVFSFPCIYIPNQYIYGFLEWFNENVVTGKVCKSYYIQNKFDDMFFMKYMKIHHKDKFVYIYEPCLVDHIDYLIGGTLNSKATRETEQIRAVSFEELDEELVKALKKELSMKYIIRCHKDRLWYVEQYLIPSMTEQGIDYFDINIAIDDGNLGNLGSWIETCKSIIKYEDMAKGTWHLQDDVLICKDFAKLTTPVKYPDDIICGFINSFELNYKEQEKTYNKLIPIDRETSRVRDSMQCIYIPNVVIKGFLEWFNKEVVENGRYENYYKQNKFDDFFFKEYLYEHKPCMQVNCDPSLVEHVDDLIGGTIINKHRKQPLVAHNFKDKDLVLELERKLK